MRLLIPLFLVGVCAACGARQHTGSGDEERKVSVRIEGNQGVADRPLMSGLSLSRAIATGQQFDPYLVSVDANRLRGFYLRRGYFAAAVRSRYDERPGEVDVVFQVTEGERARLARVEILGLPEGVDAARIRERIQLADGEPFDYAPYDAAKPFLIAPLESAGYAHARVETSVVADPERNEAVIKLAFDPGPLCEIGEVTVRGTPRGLGDVVAARIRVHPGDRYSSDKLEETQALLYETGRFAVVQVEPDRMSRDPVVSIAIELTPADRHELRLGGGVGLDPASADVHGRAGYSVTAWPTARNTTRLELRPALVTLRDEAELQPRVEATAAIERLDFVRPLVRAEAEAQLAYLTVEAYTSVGPRLRLAVRSPIGSPKVLASVGWQIRLLDFREVDEAIDATEATRLGLDVDVYRLGFYEQSLVVDLRDDPVAPRRGVYGEVRVEEGSVAAGGAFEYLRLTPELRAYWAPLLKVVLAARSRVGAIVGDVPVTQRYFAGGASSQRGFPERRLAPSASAVVDGEEQRAVVGGAALAELGVEARHPIGRVLGVQLGGVAFLDGADVTERVEDLDMLHLHWAAGAGLRAATAIGPVRLDVGFRLNRTGMDEPDPGRRFAFHLSLGEAF